MKILLLGKNGQVGWELQRSLAPLGAVVALDRSDRGGDLSLEKVTADRIRAERPDVVVNAAAYTAVDRAETEIELCRRVNASAVLEVASACADTGALFVHYSTDYVFNGEGDQPWSEDDATGPLNVYGKTKLEGEEYIKTSGCTFLNFRTSWVYGVRGNNFAKTMLRLAQEREELSVISDQFGAPTSAELIADVTAHAIKAARQNDQQTGTYHLVPTGSTTWFDYAAFCINLARSQGADIKTAPNKITPILTSEYDTAANRPLNSRLSNSKIESAFGLRMPDWQTGITRLMNSILEK
jgi:dTDP-4-dehydrorhamnose reductase